MLGEGVTSDLGSYVCIHMSNSHGVVGVCSTGFVWGGGYIALGSYVCVHMSKSYGVVGVCSTGFTLLGVHLTVVYLHTCTCQTHMV